MTERDAAGIQPQGERPRLMTREECAAMELATNILHEEIGALLRDPAFRTRPPYVPRHLREAAGDPAAATGTAPGAA